MPRFLSESDRLRQEQSKTQATEAYTKLPGHGQEWNELRIRVFSVQAAVYEVDFRVSNLAVDLRDGLRLARLAHLLTGDPSPLQVC